MRSSHLCLLLLVAGCSPPPDAPEEFDELCHFIFAHYDDENPEALVAALDNLDVWLHDHPEEPQEGYAIELLEETTVDALPGEHDVTDIRGAAVVTETGNGADLLAHALVVADQTEVFPGMYTTFERTYDGDPECFVDMECGEIEVDNWSVAEMALGIVQSSDSTGQFLWVDTDRGPTLLNRSWMNGPAGFSVDWLTAEEQLYLAVVAPREGGGVWRVQVAWLVAEIFGGEVPEGTALNLVIDGMRDRDEELYVFVDEQYGSGS